MQYSLIVLGLLVIVLCELNISIKKNSKTQYHNMMYHSNGGEIESSLIKSEQL